MTNDAPLTLRQQAIQLLARGRSRAFVAGALGVSQSQIWAWKNGQGDTEEPGEPTAYWDDRESNRRAVDPYNKKSFPPANEIVLCVWRDGFRFYGYRSGPDHVYAPLYHKRVLCRRLVHYFLTGRKPRTREDLE